MMEPKVGFNAFRMEYRVPVFPCCRADCGGERVVEEFGFEVASGGKSIVMAIHLRCDSFNCGLKKFRGFAVLDCFKHLQEHRSSSSCFLKVFVMEPSSFGVFAMVAKRIS